MWTFKAWSAGWSLGSAGWVSVGSAGNTDTQLRGIPAQSLVTFNQLKCMCQESLEAPQGISDAFMGLPEITQDLQWTCDLLKQEL